MSPELWKPLFTPFCHQLPERCFGDLPLCARCCGLYLGFTIAAVWLLVRLRTRRRPWLPRTWTWIVASWPVACVADVVLGISYSVGPGNEVRFALGLEAGLGVGILLGLFLRNWFPDVNPAPREWGPFGPFLSAAVIAALVIPQPDGLLATPLLAACFLGMIALHVLFVLAGVRVLELGLRRRRQLMARVS